MEHANAAPAASGVFRPATGRGTDGFFRAAQDAAGRWWLNDPAGALVFCRAVHEVRSPGAAGDVALLPDSVGRLRHWNFNTLGAGSDAAARDDGLAFLAAVDFCRHGPVIVAPRARLPDVFDPGWPRLAASRAAEVCPPLSADRELIGWITDDAVGWAQPSAGHSTGAGETARPSLLQICLSLEPAFAAYHAAWEFVLALHAGRLDAVARAWGTALANKEVVRELTRAERGIATRGYLRDEARWTREFARRYFTSAAAAVRAADPNHLVLGCRFRSAVGAHVLAESIYPAVDVAMPHWSELPANDASPSHPVIAGDVCWTDDAFLRQLAGVRTRRLTTLERMLQRARAALERIARHPAVVGYAWGQWQDEPGEQPPFARGLVHVNGAEAREHTELLAQFNARAEALRRVAKSKTLQP